MILEKDKEKLISLSELADQLYQAYSNKNKITPIQLNKEDSDIVWKMFSKKLIEKRGVWWLQNRL